MTHLTTQQLADIQTRADAASRGPWSLDYAYCDCSEDCGHGLYVSRIKTGAGPATELCDLPRAEWELMVHAREDIDVLLAEVHRLTAELAEMTKRARERGELAARRESELLARRAQLAAARTKTLTAEADAIVKHCPDHGPQDQDGTWMDCHCAVADDMRRRTTTPA
jgi:hypothetical protein